MTEDEPVDFFIYADQDAFYDALGPGTRENVGGQANAEIRTLFALIAPSRSTTRGSRTSSRTSSSTSSSTPPSTTRTTSRRAG